MRPILAWMKFNVVAVLAILLGLGSVIALGVIAVKAGSFLGDVEKRAGTIRQINLKFNTPVRLPPEEVDDPMREKRIVVKQVDIDWLSDVYSRMKREYEDIFELAVDHNQRYHRPMLEGLLPEPGPERSYLLFDAHKAYVQAFFDMFGDYVSDEYARLDAGMPPSTEELDAVLAQVDSEFLQQTFPARSSVAELTAEDHRELSLRKRERLLRLQKDHARNIHIYAESRQTSEFPFHLAQWAAGQRPTMWMIWDAQMGLWIQQDIVRALAIANRVSDPEYNVLVAPVKRLIKIEVLPEYIGIDLHTGPASGEQTLTDDFSKSPSGRRSNSLYDVRHAMVTLLLDFQKLPEFFDALMQTNFMSVLEMQVRDIDEYEHLRQGFLYGSGDVVEVTLKIETIWLREWTVALMPTIALERLGVIQAADPMDPSAVTPTRPTPTRPRRPRSPGLR